jgi:hypothetical protein
MPSHGPYVVGAFLTNEPHAMRYDDIYAISVDNRVTGNIDCDPAARSAGLAIMRAVSAWERKVNDLSRAERVSD